MPALMNNNKGIDPGILAMLGDRNRDGFGGNDFFAILLLFILMGWGGNGNGLFGNRGGVGGEGGEISLGTTTATAARLPEHENLFTSHKNEFLVKRIFYLDKVTGRRVGVQSLCILNENTWLSSNQVQQINNLLLSNFISRL